MSSSIPTSWEVTTLGDICERSGGLIQTGPFGSQLHSSDYVDVGVPVIMPSNIGINRILADGIAETTVEDAERLSRHRVVSGDIVYSRRGDVERRALVRPEQNGWLCGTGCLLVRVGEQGPDPSFTSFYLGHPAIREWIVRHAIGATMPNLNTGILKKVPFLLPPKNEQIAIADILSKLEDKIELNRRMNETLEAIARAIFKSWFVDFDPVRAKADGHQPAGMDAEAAALFPDSFEDSVLGKVPLGWKVSEIGDVVRVVGGSTPSTKNSSYWGGSIGFATPRDMAGLESPILLETARKITDEGLQRIGSRLLPIGTVLLSSRAPVGYLAVAETPVAINQGIIAMDCGEDVSNYFILNWTRENLPTVIGLANGTTFAEISKGNFRHIEICLPPELAIRKFAEVASPLYEKIKSNMLESRTLGQVRDSLLPKLISGEIRVKDPEKFVEEHAG